jgi:uncharacterized protein
MPDPQQFLAELAAWAADRDDIVAVALVGSYARGTAGPSSDVDVVILANNPHFYLADTAWIRHFGEANPPEHEDYKMVQSLRVTYTNGLEVEFGLTVPQWAGAEGLNAGTREIVSDGCRIIFDRHGMLADLLRTVTPTA